MSEVRLGVLALQGAFREHIAMLKRLNVEAEEVRLARELDDLDGLIIPGGESTSMGLVAERWGLVEPLRQWVHGGRPTWGTCAGMILLAEHATGQKLGGQALIGGLDVTVNRNYFGRQVDSFEADIDVPVLGDTPFHAVFIRAPAIAAVAEDVETLATVASLPDETDSVIAAVRKGTILATAFHPELTGDLRWHRFFVQIVSDFKSRSGQSGREIPL